MESAPKNDFAEYKFKNGILCIRIKKKRFIDLSAAKRIVRDRLDYQGGKSYPILCDIRWIHKFDKAAKDYFVNDGSHMIKAIAYLVTPNLNYIMYKYFIAFQKGTIKTQAFLELKQALAFLEEFSE